MSMNKSTLRLEVSAMRAVIANQATRIIELEERVNDIAAYLLKENGADDQEGNWDDVEGEWDDT